MVNLEDDWEALEKWEAVEITPAPNNGKDIHDIYLLPEQEAGRGYVTNGDWA